MVSHVRLAPALFLALAACAVDGESPVGVDADAELAPAASPKSSSTLGIDPDKELIVTDLSVVEDPARTLEPCAANEGAPLGAWTFGRLAEAMAGAGDPRILVEDWLLSWESDQRVNGYVASPRAILRERVLDPWRKRSGGSFLDLSKAPFRLLSIVNRVDLGRPKDGSAGEGRFVFGVVDVEDGCRALPFTIILEYELPSSSACDAQAWAEAFHALGALPFGEALNEELEAITSAFAGPGAMPGRPNGSALNQIRTNEAVGPRGTPWEMREFVLREGGRLVPETVKQTPDASFAGSEALARFVNENEESILAGRYVVPGEWLGASAPTPFSFVWDAPGILSPEARHAFGLSTCSGCHRTETGTPFLHVGTRNPGEPAPLSGYLTGKKMPDPVSGETRVFRELERRQRGLEKRLKMKCKDPASVDDPEMEPLAVAH